MTSSRFAKPFIVAGLTGALAISAPVATFAAEAAAPATDAAVTAPKAGGEVTYSINGLFIDGEYKLYSDTEWHRGDNDWLFQLFEHRDGGTSVLTEGVTWASSNPDVLWISSDGLEMKTPSTGSADIIAYLNGAEVARLSYQIVEYTGAAGPVEGKYAYSEWSTTSSTGDAEIGLGVRLELANWRVAPANAAGYPAGEEVTTKVVFSSSDSAVLSVNNEAGYVEALKPGTADLIATVYGEDGVTVLGEARMTYTVPGYDAIIEDSSVAFATGSDGVQCDGDNNFDVTGISYDLAAGAGSCQLGLAVNGIIFDEGSAVEYVGLSAVSSDESVVRVGKGDTADMVRLDLVGVGDATVTLTGTFRVQSDARAIEEKTVVRTVAVHVTDSTQGGGQGGQTAGEQTTEEQKPANTTNKKNNGAEGKNNAGSLPETGDPALMAAGASGAVGVGAIGAAAALRRRTR